MGRVKGATFFFFFHALCYINLGFLVISGFLLDGGTDEICPSF
jgi:hypothetical protein